MTTRKERTRDRLLNAALELFVENGYERTTVGQIAERAGVTEMTFFRHFPSKADLLIADPYDPVIAEAVHRQPTDLDPVTRAVRGVRSAWQQLSPPSTEEVRSRLRIVAETPSLRADLAGGTAATEAVIVDALVSGGVGRDAAVVAAAAVMGGLNAALLAWSLTDSDDLGRAITAALDVLEDRHG